MVNRLPLLRLLLLAITLSTLLRPISPFNSSPHSSSPPTATATASNPIIQPPQQPKPLSPPTPQHHQLLSNIVSALLAAGNFRRWATLLSAADPFPVYTATLFVPSDQALSHFPTPTAYPLPSFDPFLIPYHIIPQRLPFSSLLLFKPLTRLPTLLPSNSILITRNSGQSNFSVDGSPVTHPDLYVNSAVAVHGVNNVLDYSVYGMGDRLSITPPPVTTRGPENDTVVDPCRGRKSGAPGLGSDGVALFFVVVGAAFASKI